MKQYDAVVIGAGNGGLGAATALAHNGIKPLVIERHNMPGGVASSFVRGRFEFDTALHVLYYEGENKELWEKMGITEELLPVKQEMTFAFTDPDGKIRRFDMPMSLEAFADMTEKVVPGYGSITQKFLGVCGEIMGGMAEMSTLSEEELNKKYPHFLAFNKLTAQEVFDALEIPDLLQGILSFLWFYEGPSVSDLPFWFFAMLNLAILTGTSYFPRHCSNGFNADFENLIRKKGGDVWYNTEVTSVMVNDGKVCGVKTDRGDVVETNLVISNAAPVRVYQMMEPQSEVRPEAIQLQNSLTENMSFFVVYLGLDATAQELGLKNHHIFVNESMMPNTTYDAHFTREGPYCMGLLCHNETIPDFSPEGTCVVSISVPMRGAAWEGLSQKEYFAEKTRIAEHVIKSAGEHLGVDLMSHIEEISIATPATIARYGGMRNGALGYEHHLTNNSMICGVSEASENYIKGLSFVGQFAVLGIGYPNNVTGIKTAEAIVTAMRSEGGEENG